MYFALEPALTRIFGTPELMIESSSWQQEINSGYRRSAASGEVSSKDERIGDDGINQGRLRERMTPELHAILTIRYDDNHANRVDAWQRVQHHFRTDERLPKPFRSNPVLLRLWLMYELQHPQLRQEKGKVLIKDKGESTVCRWQQKYHAACKEWISLAEDQAQDVLEREGAIKYEG